VPHDQLVIRRAPAAGGDASAMADIWLRSFTAALPGVHRAHTDEQVLAWFRQVVVPTQESWVAEAGGRPVGLLVLDGTELEQLYLDPDWRGRGIGDRLVALAKERRPDGLTLWTFQVNVPARRFYERHGFVEAERTDGRRNEEREPDIRYVWRAPVPTASMPTAAAAADAGAARTAR
jgi:GNAT superfamily N-acetyltransferase